MVKDVSYIIVEGPIKHTSPDADWTEQYNIDAYEVGNNRRPMWRGCGPDLNSALRAICNFTGRDVEYLKTKIY